MVCILAKGSGDCPITRIPWPFASAAFAELLGHYRAGSNEALRRAVEPWTSMRAAAVVVRRGDS